MKRIAILGSSGGNLFNLGGKDPEKLMSEIISQCKGANVEIAAVQFIAAVESMDVAKDHTAAVLYRWDAGEMRLTKMYEGPLKETNQAAMVLDTEIAGQIQAGQIDGIIVMSADPNQANQQAMIAAVEKRIPVVGTGGTSMALISSKGANVIATSGTTGTTNRTRAVSFMTSLCKYWGIKYHPVLGDTSTQHASVSSNPWRKINLKGIMQASLPGFIAMAIVLAISQIPALKGLSEVFDLMLKALPVVLAVIAAKQISDLDEVSIVAGVIAGTLSINGGIIGGIIGGIGAGLLVQYLFVKCVQWRFPMTTVNIVAGGFAGLISGLIMYYLIAPFALQAGELMKYLINEAISFNPIVAGVVAGLLIWPAILGGVYHAAILPIVLLEMEKTGNSFLGAVDMVGLVMVSAGITLANIIAPRDKGEAAVATPGFLINMGFGTFVEAAYPFMFSNKMVFAGAILAGGVGGGLVGVFNVRGTAYVPSFMGPLLSNNVMGFTIAMAVALLLSLVITLVANKAVRNKKNLEPTTQVEQSA
ncbi:PTS sugar transporter [Paenibacillus selenitireducens]|uniref:PTS sugar transporter n=1 Tax=Paenibacillus selenitireducens TaxID=1324314 RepID=A0A1T2XH65_9BACL|nr:PTS sugar transporter [Paenibacillus selenitireducens]OPA79210.1 PTS sugar transporter [Paenibacillus selenitireducens]